jgi:hypothetical protein
MRNWTSSARTDQLTGEMVEFQTMQRMELEPFVRWKDLSVFMDVFDPSLDPAHVLSYNGRFTNAAPWEDAALVDVLPMNKFFRGAVHMQCCVGAANKGSVQHGDHIVDRMFGTTNSLREYLDMPNARSLECGLFRSHQMFAILHAKLEIYFQPPAEDEPKDELDWVDERTGHGPETIPC